MASCLGKVVKQIFNISLEHWQNINYFSPISISNMTLQSKEWILTMCAGLDDLKMRTVGVPSLGNFDVLVKMKALSLNHRDVVLAMVGYSTKNCPSTDMILCRAYILCRPSRTSLPDQTEPAK